MSNFAMRNFGDTQRARIAKLDRTALEAALFYFVGANISKADALTNSVWSEAIAQYGEDATRTGGELTIDLAREWRKMRRALSDAAEAFDNTYRSSIE